MKTIFIALGRIIHYSDILRSKLLPELLERWRVVVLTPDLDPAEARRNGFPTHPNLVYKTMALAHPSAWGKINQHVRLTLVREYDSWIITRHWDYRTTHPLRIRILMGVGSLLPKKLITTPRVTALESLFFKPGKQFLDLAAEERPVLIATATPGFTEFEAEIIHGAAAAGIRTIALELNYDNSYSQAKYFRATDAVVVWSPVMREQVIGFNHYPPEKVFMAGCLRFDHYAADPASGRMRPRADFLRAKNLNPDEKTIVVAGPSPIIHPGRVETVSHLVRLRREKRLPGNPNILVRLHPHDIAKPYEQFRGIPGLWIERAGTQRLADTATRGSKIEMEERDLFNLTETLAWADIVVNFASTMIIEACIFNKPVISINFPEQAHIVNTYENNKALIDAGCLRLASSPEELAGHIAHYFLHPEEEEKERRAVVERHVRFTDGQSWKRVADIIDGFAGAHPFAQTL